MKFIVDTLISQCNALGVSVSCTIPTTHYHEACLPSTARICKYRLQKNSYPSGSPCFGLPLEKSMPFSKTSTLCWRNRKSHPERSYQPSDVPAVEDPSGNPICISLLPETHGVKSLQICPATRCPLLLHSSLPPITLSFSPRATCGQSLRCAEELLLGSLLH